MKARFNSKHCKLTIILCYALTNESDKEDKEDWYEQLQQAVAKVPQLDMLLIIGDMNAKVGSDNSNCERAMGKHGCGVMNDNGERLVDYCLNNNYVIGGTVFAHRDIPKKDNLQVCDNWRGITLLSIPNKVFCRILLGRIEIVIDKKLRQEQAGSGLCIEKHHRADSRMELPTVYQLH